MKRTESPSIDERLRRALEIIAEAAGSVGAKWLIGGSTGLLLRGMALQAPPRDLDLYADDEAAKKLHGALRLYASDEQQLSVSPIYRSVLSHYDIQGVQVELVGGFVVQSSAGDRYVVEVEDVLDPLRTTVTFGDHSAGVVPLAHEFWFNMLRERPDRVALIARRMREEAGLHQATVDRLASRNGLSAAMRDRAVRTLREH